MRTSSFVCIVVLFLSSNVMTHTAQATVYGPTPYLSFNDSPFAGSSYEYFYLENSESTPEGQAPHPYGVTVSSGTVISGPGASSDSVDADDGTIDGCGAGGKEMAVRATSATFTFSRQVLGSLPTVAGIVWTDIGGPTYDSQFGNVTFQAYDASGQLIATVGPTRVGDGSGYCQTAEDRFFGVSYAGGISKVRISMDGSTDWGCDHLQYGMQRGDGNPNPPSTTHTGAVVRSDFDGDGKSDIAVYSSNSGLMKARLSSGAKSTTYQLAKHGRAACADFNGDGLVDPATFVSSTAEWTIRDGGQTRHVQFGTPGSTPVPADYDGDGRADLAVFEPATANWYVLGSTVGMLTFQLGAPGAKPFAADFDGDGLDDPGVYLAASGSWKIQESTAGLQEFQFGFNGTVPFFGDFDGDARLDIGVYQPQSGRWYFQMTTAGQSVITLGNKLSIPVVGDYDGDGISDIASFMSLRGGYWSLYESSQGYDVLRFGPFLSTPVGAIP